MIQSSCNPILRTDSYKLTHWNQYPVGTEHVYSYLESRGGFFDETVLVGTRYYLKEYLEGVRLTAAIVEEARYFAQEHFGSDKIFNHQGWYNLLAKHGGIIPLKIQALPEGSVVNTHTPLITVVNTDPEFPWLTNWAESLLLKIWYPTTVGTLSREIKKVILEYLEKTGTVESLPYKLIDFGYRGVSSEESAAIGGFAHLLIFNGSETMPAIYLAQKMYGAKMPANAIVATEHSTITSWGEEHEVDAYENLLDKNPEEIIACVSDSYDIQNAVENLWGGILRDKVLDRKGTLVVRPDSGDPVNVMRGVLTGLAEKFGYEVNSKGYKVLDPRVRALQGDGVNYQTIRNMNAVLTGEGWSMDNWSYGMGGALLQQLNRDTLKFAFKCSAIKVNGEWRDVYKRPATDPGKNSKRGRFVVTYNGHEYVTSQLQDDRIVTGDMLGTVFEDGVVYSDSNFYEIRSRAGIGFGPK